MFYIPLICFDILVSQRLFVVYNCHYCLPTIRTHISDLIDPSILLLNPLRSRGLSVVLSYDYTLPAHFGVNAMLQL